MVASTCSQQHSMLENNGVLKRLYTWKRGLGVSGKLMLTLSHFIGANYRYCPKGIIIQDRDVDTRQRCWYAPHKPIKGLLKSVKSFLTMRNKTHKAKKGKHKPQSKK